ncbi:hypothetical protein [Massilibacteroides sp.]|uniref:hypothetical protein n=1 Tax=Massilibacteroides sp. TaxID=2034766 RepID=UPI00260D8FDC|nr:hypothetical protein [Massilibacteroides sp.]MDD4516194.1 hypothetical protein [Massilibacteroides sp.]
MKTTKIFLTILIVLLAMSSCETYYKVVTTIDKESHTQREVYALADSVFLKGDQSATPFLFNVNNGWTLTYLDSTVSNKFMGHEMKFNIMASKEAICLADYSENGGITGINRSFFSPVESLTKQFRWFYTYYSFKAVYKKLEAEIPVSIDNYLTKEEQRLWTQGDIEALKGYNGSEITSILSDIETKFIDWFHRNCFEVSLTLINEKSNENDFSDVDKDQLFNDIRKRENGDDIEPGNVCIALDQYYKTTRYSELYKAKKEEFDADFETETSLVNAINIVLCYELNVPYTILNANTNNVSRTNIKWKIDGLRLLTNDYTATATYRASNIWAFIVTGGVILFTIVGFIAFFRNRKS